MEVSEKFEIRQAPAVLDLEKEFVNHLQVQKSLEYILQEGVTRDLLYNPKTKAVYQFVQHHFDTTAKVPTEKVLKHEFPNADFEAPETEISWIIDKLKKRYKQNKVESLTVKLAESVEDPDQAMSYLREEFMEIEKNSLSSRNVFVPGDHTMFISDLQAKISQGHYKGASFGYKEIDDFTGGLRNGQIGYLLARPKCQKTFNVCQAWIANARMGRKPYLHTLEISKEEVELRISCMLSGVPWDAAQKGALMPQDYKKFRQAWEDFNDECEAAAGIREAYWIEQPNMDERTVPSLIMKADKVGAEAIMISQFRYIDGLRDFYRSEHEKHAEVALSLKQACTRPGSERPFYVEAQFNRGGDSMEELEDFDAGKVGLTDMIPQSADILLGLFRSKDLRANQQTEFGIIESRNTDQAAWYVKSEFKSETKLELVSGSKH
jgi:hypothetical protein